MTRRELGEAEADRLLLALDLDPATLVDWADNLTGAADHLYVLRHALMNPWLESVPNTDGDTYV
ncbi:hypothetical protein ABTL76_19505, partial [Acinetobacter baumannii]